VSTPSRAWRVWDRLTIYLPVILMGLLALGTYWLARNTPSFAPAAAPRPPRHEADYFLRNFSVKSFDADGRLQTEMQGVEARHYPDTDTTEIDLPRIRSYNAQGTLIVATAKKAISNADASQVQLIGDAVVRRTPRPAPGASPAPPLEIRGEFLHAYLDAERVESDKPVTLARGGNVFHGDSMEFDNLERTLELRGRVRGTLQPRGAAR
jgi:lipopolysaccharide export system protein LptC